MGALMMHFMLETIIAGRMLGVDPFDQPAVEEGKILARVPDSVFFCQGKI